MKKIALILAAGIVTLTVSAQQISQQSQYMLNEFFFNPAVAGTKEYSPLRLSIRSQWTAFADGVGPKTQVLSFHTNYFDNMGVGGYIINDKTGPLSQTGLQASYAYHLQVSDDAKLSLGLSGRMLQYSLDESEITTYDGNDPAFTGVIDKSLVPDAGFGAYFYAPQYFVGLSIPQLFHSRLRYDSDDDRLNKEVRHYYLNGGAHIDINDDFRVSPSLMVKTIFTAPTQVDVNAMATYKKMVSLGVSYRHKDAVVALVAFKKDMFTIGYSYDVTLSDIRKYNAGSHEIMLGVDIEGNASKGRKRYSPRMR